MRVCKAQFYMLLAGKQRADPKDLYLIRGQSTGLQVEMHCRLDMADLVHIHSLPFQRYLYISRGGCCIGAADGCATNELLLFH